MTLSSACQIKCYIYNSYRKVKRSTDKLGSVWSKLLNKKHSKNVGPIRHCVPFYVAIDAAVARCLRIDVHDNDDNDNDNA